MSYLPDISMGHGVALSRREQKALARQEGMAGLELLGVHRTELVERARVRALGGIVGDAIEEAGKLADQVAGIAQHNAFAGQLGAELAITANREMKDRIDLANRRLG